MNILHTLRQRFVPALAALVADPAPLLEMIRPAQDPKFGDYQANFSMSLGKQLGQPPREVAQQVAAQVSLDDICEQVEVAGPGFINLRLKDSWLAEQFATAMNDDRLGVAPVAEPQTYIVDYSSPNVAKPMHVGHIRSTVIGDALYRTLKFAGHNVISDNHLGDWGTQFGMIIYGYKHFVDREAYASAPLVELLRLYRLVNQLIGYREGLRALPEREQKLAAQVAAQAELQAQAAAATDKKQQDKLRKQAEKQQKSLAAEQESLDELRHKLAQVDHDPQLAALADTHAEIASAVLQETAKLHSGDAENLRLWHEFLPACRQDIQKIYDRLGVRFDHELGESFYHDQLAAVVQDLEAQGLARKSDGATCVFLDGFEAPMIIRKKDGAFLYSTTDLATIKYRAERWHPDVVLYVVDFRQGDHFEKLFAAAKLWGYEQLDLRHIGFGTILGEDGKPIKTRSGETISLEGLLDEAVAQASKVVAEIDDAQPGGGQLSADERQAVAEVVGIGGLKYIDLSQNRESDYKFSYDKMLAKTGNTATYMQYSYARVRSIFRRGNTTPEEVRRLQSDVSLAQPAERALALEILRFSEALDEVLVDFRPNLLTNYLFELAKKFSTFFEQCAVLKAETPALQQSRLLLADTAARTIQTGLALLGIQTVEKM
jgi:arginyl-tRNA synthetase